MIPGKRFLKSFERSFVIFFEQYQPLIGTGRGVLRRQSKSGCKFLLGFTESVARVVMLPIQSDAIKKMFAGFRRLRDQQATR